MAHTYQSCAAPTWVPNGQVWAMAVTPSRIYLGGDFTSLRNPVTGAVVARNHLAAIDRAPANRLQLGAVRGRCRHCRFGPDSPPVTALLVGPTATVYVGGDFNTIGGKARNFAAAVNKDGVVLDSFNPVLNARVWDFALAGIVALHGRPVRQTSNGADPTPAAAVACRRPTSWRHGRDLGRQTLTGGRHRPSHVRQHRLPRRHVRDDPRARPSSSSAR